MPVSYPIQEGDLIVFAGQRWRAETIDDRGKTIDVVRSSGGRPPAFEGGATSVHDTVRRRMLGIYLGADLPVYLDQTASELLIEGRRNFARHSLANKAIVADSGRTHLVVWRGDRVISTLVIALSSRGLEVGPHGMVLTISADETTTAEAVRSLAAQEPPKATELARHIGNKVTDKWDDVLDEPLLELACASRDLDVTGSWNELTALRSRLS